LFGVLVLGVGGAAIAVHRPAYGSRAPPPTFLAHAGHLRIVGLHGHGRIDGLVQRAGGRVLGVDHRTGQWTRLPQALLWSQGYHRPPWEGLDRLAGRFALSDLSDLARSSGPGRDGARIRDTLETKASSLRLSETTALEHDAQAVTQKMLLPGVLLMAGYGAYSSSILCASPHSPDPHL